ncbi:hypothetical protein GCM10010869_05940 [Mesorhizobium tianshanense]|uniref:Uncharacterized protein n=1 Tax=Mesorhizobium tianshanense TaxID=39844 RepID=A0A562NLW7_9HYPH|nr:hypothetical protein IQ26_04123 [Mesorhizobium tianshanense]GLS35006.1 hypothetical protein GCM10010869_05940 [Mesorhizobium tianshanense]
MCGYFDQHIVVALRAYDGCARDHGDVSADQGIAPKVPDAGRPEPERAFGKHDDPVPPRGSHDRGDQVTLPLQGAVAA